MKQQVISLFSEALSACVLCGSTQASEYERLEHQGIPLFYRICDSCGLVYQSPRIPETKTPEFYKDLYRLLYLGQATPREQELEVQRKRALHLVAFLDKDEWSPTHHLDIGCGSGALLHATQLKFNCKVSGIELDQAHRVFANQNGLQVYASLESWLDGACQADLVSMSHVLEHLADPVEYLVQIRRQVLAHEGRLLIEVPNLYYHSSLEIAHTFAFSLTTLCNVLHKAGFKLIRYRLHSVPRSRSLPMYIAVLARPDESVVRRPVRMDRYSRERRTTGRRLISVEGAIRRRFIYVLRKFRVHRQARLTQ